MADGPLRASALAPPAIAGTPTIHAAIMLRARHPLVMLNLRGGGDLAFYDSARLALGCALPAVPNTSSNGADGGILWLGPSEWLLVADPGTRWSEDMTIAGGTLSDVSHGRVVVRISGEKARDVLSKGCAIDLHPGQFPPGTCAQTSIAKINVILHHPGNGSDFDLYAPRSYAGSCWHWLTAAAAEYACPAAPI